MEPYQGTETQNFKNSTLGLSKKTQNKTKQTDKQTN